MHHYNEYDEDYQAYVAKKLDIETQLKRINEYIQYWKMKDDVNNETLITALEYVVYNLENKMKELENDYNGKSDEEN